MAGAKVVISGEDRTKPAFDSVKRGLVDVVDASGKASGSMERFLKLSPQMIAIGAAGAAVAGTFRGIYKNSTELQAASNELGTSWKSLTAELGKTEGAKSAADAIKWVAGAFDSLRKSIEDPPKQSWLERQSSELDTVADDIAKAQAQILEKRDNPLAFWLPSEEELRTKIAALQTYVVAASRKLNEDVAKNGRPMDAFNPKQFTDAEWADLQGKSARAYDAMKAASKDKADSEKADIERTRDAAKSLADQYMAVYTATRTPQEEFNDELARANRLFQELGDVDIYSRQIAAAREKVGSVSASDPADAKGRESYMRLQASLQTEEESIAGSYERRQFIVEDAFQRGLVNEQGYNELSTQLWAENEARKSLILEEGIRYRHDLEFAANQATLDLTAQGLGAAAALIGSRSKAAFEVSKALRMGETLVSTYAAAQKAYESQLTIPTPDAPARAAAAKAVAWGVGIAHVAGIARTSFGSASASSGGGGGGGSSGGGGGGSTGSTGDQSPLTPTRGSSGGVVNVRVEGEIFNADTVRKITDIQRDAYERGQEVLFSYDSRAARVIRGEAV